jgi:hypothetical protein
LPSNVSKYFVRQSAGAEEDGWMKGTDESSRQLTTEEWAASLGISTALTPLAIESVEEQCSFTARQIAIRAVILQGVVAVAFEVDPDPVIEWYREQGVWDQVSPKEQAFLLDPASLSRNEWYILRRHQEAEWTLLWVVGKVESLGLPNRRCDTKRLVDTIIPALGTDIELFLTSARLKPPGVLLAEDNRHYDLWCRYFQTRRQGSHSLPHDLEVSVLYERQYAFNWLHGIEAWGDVQCDS